MEIDLGELGKRILIWFIPVLLIIGIVRLCVNDSDNESSSKSHSEMTVNGRYTISTECFGTLTKGAMDELVRHVGNDNARGFADQIASGDVVFLEEGTQVILADYEKAICKVDITSGPNAGKTVYVLTEFVKR